MKFEQLGVEHESAFLKMIDDYTENDPKSLRLLFPEKAPSTTFEFKQFAKDCEKEKMDWSPKAKKVSVTRYLLLEEDGSVAAMGLMRFPLDEITEVDGGQFEVGVPPSKRRQQNGVYCLNRLLFEAVRAGLSRALVTCPSDNVAARRSIEKNRGEFLDEVPSRVSKGASIARYWIRFRG
jgi:predicted acetyltransferase